MTDEPREVKPPSLRLVDGPDVLKGLFDVKSLEMGTLMSLERVKRFRRSLAHYEIDDQKVSRLTHRKCKTCFYFDYGVAGQSFSQRECKSASCTELSRWHNTAVPDYCADCSKMYGICRTCGGDIEQRERRSLKPPKR